MTTIYCDESGNSGEELIDKDQPFFVLASNDFSKSEALDLLEHVRSPQAVEAKFKTLKKSAAGRNGLTKLFADPRLNRNRVVVDMFHKRFMVVTKIVDLIYETIFHDMGEDLYKHGANLAMANMLYYCMPAFCGQNNTDNLLKSFVRMLRQRTSASIKAFFLAGQTMVDASINEEFKVHLIPISSPELLGDWFPFIGEMPLEPAVPSLFQHISEWGRRKSHRFNIIHDSSKPVLASQETFVSMMALSEESSNMIGYDRRKYLFPLRAKSLEQGNSLEYPQIQIADLCSGAINHFLKCRESKQMDELAEMIYAMKCPEWLINGIYPTTDISPQELGTDTPDGTNPIDPVVQYLRSKQQN